MRFFHSRGLSAKLIPLFTVGPSLSLAISSSTAASLVPSSPSRPVFACSVRYLTKPNGFFSVLLRENQFAFFLLLFFLSRSPLPRSAAHAVLPPPFLPPPLPAFAGSAFILTSPSSSLKGIKVIAQMITQTSVAMKRGHVTGTGMHRAQQRSRLVSQRWKASARLCVPAFLVFCSISPFLSLCVGLTRGREGKESAKERPSMLLLPVFRFV